jgi:hypothetical protein
VFNQNGNPSMRASSGMRNELSPTLIEELLRMLNRIPKSVFNGCRRRAVDEHRARQSSAENDRARSVPRSESFFEGVSARIQAG